MTRDEILNMEAGRKMDALVAEKIFAFTQVQFMHSGDVGGYRADGWGWCSLPHYSTDIAAAFEVVEKMLSNVWGLHIEHEDMWWCLFFRFGDPELPEEFEEGCSEAPTAPLAICRAALLAVMGAAP